MKFRSTITPELKRKTLFRGTAVSLIGISALFYAYFYVSENTLEKWGWAFYLWGLLLIVWGMLPYRRLLKIEDLPFELWSTGTGELELLNFGKNNRPFWKIFANKISSFSFKGDSTYYGIEIHAGDKKYFCPYFSRRTCEELKEYFTALPEQECTPEPHQK